MADGRTDGATPDVEASVAFLASNGRLLDRRRLQLLLGRGSADGVRTALAAYRNPDGGYGWGLEPDLRAPESQPVGAMHALEVLAEDGVAGPDELVAVRELCGWLQRHTLPDGGLPLALPMRDPSGTAALWATAPTDRSSLQMTTQVAAQLHVLARTHPSIATERWLAGATSYCLESIGSLSRGAGAYELLFSVRFLDAAAHREPRANALIDHLAGHLPSDGSLPVTGGAEGEALHLLDLSSHPSYPSRRLFTDDAVRDDLVRLAAGQQPDGGWTVNFDASSAAAALEWRSYATVQALTILRSHRTPA